MPACGLLKKRQADIYMTAGAPDRQGTGAQEPGGWYCLLAAPAFLIEVMASSMDISTVVFDAAATPAPRAVNNGAAALALSGASYNKTTSYSPKAKKIVVQLAANRLKQLANGSSAILRFGHHRLDRVFGKLCLRKIERHFGLPSLAPAYRRSFLRH
jgi:hypothetical protein